MLFGLFLLMYLSDSYLAQFSFAKPIKPFYLLGIGAAFFLGRNEMRQGSKFYFVFIPFITLAFLLIAKSERPSAALQKTISYLLLVLLIPNITVQLFKKYGPVIFKHFVVLITLLLFVAIILRLAGVSMVGLNRFHGFLGNPNAIGLNCTTFFIFFLVVKQYFPQVFSRIEILIIYAVIAYSCIESGSRNAIFSISLFLILSRFFKVSQVLGMIILFLGVLAYQIIIENSQVIIQQIGLSSFLRANTLESGSGRLVAWQFGWEQIQLNFFFGKGLGHEEYIYFSEGNQQMLNLLGTDGGAHNSFISIWLSTGLFGLLLFMYALVSKFVIAAKNTFLALPILAMILFSAFFESWLIGSLNPYTILIIISLTIMTSHEFNKEKPQGSFSIL